MLKDEQLFNGKVFIRSYLDAIRCLQQVAIKECSLRHYKYFYFAAKEPAKDSPEDISKEESLRIFRFSKLFLRKYFFPEPPSYDDLIEQFTKIANDLKENAEVKT